MRPCVAAYLPSLCSYFNLLWITRHCFTKENTFQERFSAFYYYYLSIYFYQTPIEKLQNHQEALKDEVMTVKSKLKAVLDHTTQLEAMMKALMKHHGISVEEEEEGEDDD